MSLPDLKQPKSPEQHRYHYLDALRGLAAVFVVLLHFPKNSFFNKLAESSYLAVDFFFCLSGFVVALSYQQRLETKLGFKEFAIARLIRLHPSAFLGTVIGALFLLNDHSILVWKSLPLWGAVPYAILSGLLILPLPRGFLFPLDGPMWTLFLELLANFSFALLVRLRLARSGWLAGISALAFIGLLYDRSKYYRLDGGFTSYTVFVGIHRVCFSFFAGVLLYRFYMRRRPARIHGIRAWIIATVGTGMLILLFLTPARVMRSTAVDLLAVAVVFPSLVYWGARLQLPSFTTKAFAAIGATSYPLYILHRPLVGPLYWIYSRPGPANDFTAITYVAILVVLAWVVATYYELPIRRAITRKLRSERLGVQALPRSEQETTR